MNKTFNDNIQPVFSYSGSNIPDLIERQFTGGNDHFSSERCIKAYSTVIADGCLR